MPHTPNRCTTCGDAFDRSAITDSVLLTTAGRSSALVHGGGDGDPGIHLHDVVITDRGLLTWHGFIVYKTRRIRYKIRSFFGKGVTL